MRRCTAAARFGAAFVLCRGLALQYAEEKLWRSPLLHAVRTCSGARRGIAARCGTAAAAVAWRAQCTAMRAAVEMDGSGRTAPQPVSEMSDASVSCANGASVGPVTTTLIYSSPSVLQAASSFCNFWIFIGSRARRLVPKASAGEARAGELFWLCRSLQRLRRAVPQLWQR